VQLTSDANESKVWPPSRNVHGEDLDLMLRRANDWTLDELIKSGVVRVSSSDPFFSTSPSSSLLDALAHFGRGVHHLLIVDDVGKVVNMLSQTDVIRFIANDVSCLGALRSKTVGQLGLGDRNVFCVRNSDAALDSFFEIYAEGVSGGAIINAEGKLVGNLSRQDLKGTQGGTGFKVLAQSIMHYQRKHRVALAQRLVTVNADMALGDIVLTMAREKVHRVFLVEGGMYPKGLMTQTDICRVIYHHFVGEDARLGKRAVKRLMAEHASRVLSFPLSFPPQ
jgi:CBS-domain-containing membrane protein